MPSKIVRIRERNQITLPPEILEAVSLRTGDFLEISVTSEGMLTIAPKRLVTWNTPEAEEADREAELDIAQKRFRTFTNAGAFAEALKGKKGTSGEPLQINPSKPDEGEELRRASRTSRGDRARAARILGISLRTLSRRLQQYHPPATEKP